MKPTSKILPPTSTRLAVKAPPSSADVTIAADVARASSFGYPPNLVKACRDSFTYLAALKSGGHVRFESAEPISKKWVRLIGVNLYPVPSDYQTERALDVDLESIAWVMDEPIPF